MQLIHLFYNFVPTFIVTYYLWWMLSDRFPLCTHLSMFITIGIISWTMAYFIYDRKNSSQMQTKTSDKIVLITGCDSGFGSQLARRLDRHGFQVIAGVINTEGDGAKSLRADCSSRVKIVKMDVTKEEDVKSIVPIVEEMKGTLWAVVNNAGIGTSGFFDWGHDVDEFRRVFEVNVFGLVRVTKYMMPLLKRSPGSRLVNIASLAGRISSPYLSHYSMTKHAVRSFSDSIRRELAITGDNVHVVTIEPTYYQTAIIQTVNATQGIDRLWNETPLLTQKSYTDESRKRQTKQQLKTSKMTRTNINEVIDVMADAVRLMEPKVYYRCCGYLDVILWAVSHAPEIILDRAIALSH